MKLSGVIAATETPAKHAAQKLAVVGVLCTKTNIIKVVSIKPVT